MSVKFSIQWAMGHETLGHMNVLRESKRRHCSFLNLETRSSRSWPADSCQWTDAEQNL